MTKVKFFYNGIKVNGEKKLYKAFLSFQEGWTCGNRETPTQLTISSRDYKGFPIELNELFEIQNETDYNTDYFDKDRIRIQPNHPLFKEAAKAYIKYEEKIIKKFEDFQKKNGTRHYDHDGYVNRLNEFKAKYL